MAPAARAASVTLLVAGLAAAPLLLLALVAPALALPPVAANLVAFAAAAAAIVGAIVGATAAAPTDLLARPRAAAAAFAAGLLLGALAFVLPPVASGVASSLGVIACASALGTAVGRRIAAPGHLLAVALVSAAVDLWSVTSPAGPTHRIVQNPVLVRLLTVSVAVPPDRTPQPAIGFGDVVFAAVYMAAAARFGLPRGRTAGALGVALFGAGALALGLHAAVPALPLLGAAVVAVHPATRRVLREDRAATWFAALLLLASAARAATR